MKSKLWLSFLATLFGIVSCQEWGEMDPPAGNQVFPKLELKGDFKFEAELSEDVVLEAYEGGQSPRVVTDEFKGKVMQLSGGYARFNSALSNVKLQTGASLTMWVKTSGDNL